MEKDKVNPLGTEPVGRLLRKFAIPSIISMLVTSLYNIVDQFFIGRTVGELGNAATNIAFPLTTMCLAAMLALVVRQGLTLIWVQEIRRRLCILLEMHLR